MPGTLAVNAAGICCRNKFPLSQSGRPLNTQIVDMGCEAQAGIILRCKTLVLAELVLYGTVLMNSVHLCCFIHEGLHL